MGLPRQRVVAVGRGRRREVRWEVVGKGQGVMGELFFYTLFTRFSAVHLLVLKIKKVTVLIASYRVRCKEDSMNLGPRE